MLAALGAFPSVLVAGSSVLAAVAMRQLGEIVLLAAVAVAVAAASDLHASVPGPVAYAVVGFAGSAALYVAVVVGVFA